MVLGHFFLFTSLRNSIRWWFIVFFAAALLTLISPFFILGDFNFGAWIKLISVVFLLFLSIGLSGMLLRLTRYM